MRVLIVEDEKKVAKALREGLEAEHYDVRVACTGEEGFFLVNHESDRTFTGGWVGLWTKADSVTEFADLDVTGTPTK